MSSKVREPVSIIYADDDPQDRWMIRDALAKDHLENELHCVEDGDELLQFLRAEGPFSHRVGAPKPGLILLDLDMPRMNGRRVLQELKADPALRRLPVVVVTSSAREEDIVESYDLGVAGYVRKPVTLPDMVEIVRGLNEYWFRIVHRPPS